jgi:hypothetical protein
MTELSELRVSFALLLLAVVGSFGCAPGPQTEVVVVRDLTFVREDVEGVSDGFNLDGLVSDESDAGGCFRPDLVDSEGNTGIDNAFSNILPALELTEASAVEPLIKAAIDEGRLLLMITMDDVGGRTEDDCVDLLLSRASGPPALGGDGMILPGQTYDHDPGAPQSMVECGVLSDGLLTASPLNMRLPLQVFDEQVDVSLFDGIFEIEMSEEGLYHGRFGGGIDIAALMANIYTFDGVGDEVFDLLDSVLGINADLMPNENGVCQRLSVAFEFEAVSAYFFVD